MRIRVPDNPATPDNANTRTLIIMMIIGKSFSINSRVRLFFDLNPNLEFDGNKKYIFRCIKKDLKAVSKIKKAVRFKPIDRSADRNKLIKKFTEIHAKQVRESRWLNYVLGL